MAKGPTLEEGAEQARVPVDPKYIKGGLIAAAGEGGRWTITEGTDSTKRNVSLRLGTELLLKGTGMTLADFDALTKDLAKDHLHFSDLVQEVFLGVLVGVGAVGP